ncbi:MULTISPECIES: hypothetical protein [unclassified Adlercreutzia]|uniref:hypothetical protein n=1 Tax=unclassified Adlercreutzia TaxID=2636013 RepID=UPI0013EA0265|nr:MULTISPECIES: hypothetical protein [unclassified Adlercreutzia]
MALTRSEKRTAVLAVVVVLAVGVFWMGFSVVEGINLRRQIASFDDFKRQHAMVFRQGDVVRCDSGEDESLVDDAGWAYQAGFDWDGTMNFTVEESWLFDEMADACSMIGVEPDGVGREERAGVLLVKVRVENIDARPSSDRGFNISVLRGPSEISFFSGAVEENGEKGYYYFDLAPGESGVYYVGYEAFPEAASEEPCLHVGTHADEVEKMTVVCDPHDERSGERS